MPGTFALSIVPRFAETAENGRRPVAQLQEVRKVVVKMVRHDIDRQSGVLLKFHPDAVWPHRNAFGKPSFPLNSRCTLVAGIAPLLEVVCDVSHLHAEVIHGGACGAAGRLGLPQRDQHARNLDNGQRTLFDEHTTELLDPELLVNLHVANVEMHVAEGHARLIGSGG